MTELRELQLLGATASVWYDSRIWGEPETDSDGVVSLDRVVGAGYAVIITEQGGAPSDLVADTLFEELKKKYPELEVLLREKRIVNGQEVWCLKYSMVSKETPVILFVYLYSGLSGTVQVRTCAGAASFDECEADFTQLLNSLQIRRPKHPLFVQMRRTVGIAGRVFLLALPAVGGGLFRFAGHMSWKYALLWGGVLAVGVFLAAWGYAMVKLRLK
jgi:hypothetical protein